MNVSQPECVSDDKLMLGGSKCVDCPTSSELDGSAGCGGGMLGTPVLEWPGQENCCFRPSRATLRDPVSKNKTRRASDRLLNLLSLLLRAPSDPLLYNFTTRRTQGFVINLWVFSPADLIVSNNKC